MSYSVRNSIILALIFIIFGGGGYAWLHFKFTTKTVSMLEEVVEKENTLAGLEASMVDYEYLQEELYKTTAQFEYFPKLLPPESAVQGTYRYLDKLSTRRASFNYDFRFTGIKRENGAIKASYTLTGVGKFANIANFIYRLENGKPIYKIGSLNFKRKLARGTEKRGLVEVSMQLTGLFNDNKDQTDSEIARMFEKSLVYPGMRVKILQESQHKQMQYHTVRAGETLKLIAKQLLGSTGRWREIYRLNQSRVKNPHMIYVGQKLKIVEKTVEDYFIIHEVRLGETLRSLAEQYFGDENRWRDIYKWNQDRIENQIPDDILTNYDPFRPLVLASLPPNIYNRVNVDRSKLIALTSKSAFIQDQKGELKEMKVGDKIYLGFLSRIDLNNGKVIFNLNKGGIYSTATLNLANTGRN